MNPEQFIIWINGYLIGGRDNDSDTVVEDILEAIKKVKIDAPVALSWLAKE